MRFTYEQHPSRIVFGAGTVHTELPTEINRLRATRVLLITTERARTLATPLGDRVAATFTGVRPHVPVDVAEQARALATSAGADAVLSIGGGSATGTAKAVALTTGLPVIAVPTTYAGSEVTPVWGLTDGSRKTTGTDPRVLPKTVVYDPELTLALPPDVTAASGLNALAHAVEALWAPHANPVTALLAEEAIRVLTTALPTVPLDLDTRTDLLTGAYLAGSAFAVTGSGPHHKLCHVLGGAYDLPHAETHAIVLPEVVALMTDTRPDAVARIGRALGTDNPARALRELAAHLGIPRGLRALGLREDQVDQATDLAAAAVPIDRDALRQVVHAAWHG